VRIRRLEVSVSLLDLRDGDHTLLANRSDPVLLQIAGATHMGGSLRWRGVHLTRMA
jgi:hypothetical protein